MSQGVRTLGKGDTTVFTTRPAGMSTSLTVQPSKDSAGNVFDVKGAWHIELCGQGDHEVSVKANEAQKIDVSSAAGALITVKNEGTSPFDTWVDY